MIPDLSCEKDLALKVEILRIAGKNVGHEISEGFENGCFDEMFVAVCGEIEISELTDNQKERLLSIVSEMVEVKREEERFLVMMYQVTQALWESVTRSNPSHFRGDSRPVENVSWFDCILFANQLSKKKGLEKVYEIPKELTLGSSQDDDLASQVIVNESANGYRLSTETEWDYAAKGGEDYTYTGSDDLNEVGWFWDKSGRKTRGVGQKKSNGYGLYDMSGNVWEWCFDKWYDDWSTPLVLGGCWNDFADGCEVGIHHRGNPSDRFIDYGVRLFRSVPLRP